MDSCNHKYSHLPNNPSTSIVQIYIKDYMNFREVLISDKDLISLLGSFIIINKTPETRLKT